MPKGPRIEDRGKREFAIAGVMALLLIASLVICAVVTGAGLGG